MKITDIYYLETRQWQGMIIETDEGPIECLLSEFCDCCNGDTVRMDRVTHEGEMFPYSAESELISNTYVFQETYRQGEPVDPPEADAEQLASIAECKAPFLGQTIIKIEIGKLYLTDDVDAGWGPCSNKSITLVLANGLIYKIVACSPSGMERKYRFVHGLTVEEGEMDAVTVQ